MESSADAIKIAVATIITAVVITIVLFISGMLNTSTNKAADSAITTVNEVINYDIKAVHWPDSAKWRHCT